MAAFNKFYPFVEALAEQVHNLGTNTLKVMLVNSPAPITADSVKANLTEISAGNGYTAGGPTVVITSSAQTSGVYTLVGTDITLTASGGSVGPFRFAVMYNDTAVSKNLIGWWDYGSTITLASGDSLTIDFDAVNGILTLA